MRSAPIISLLAVAVAGCTTAAPESALDAETCFEVPQALKLGPKLEHATSGMATSNGQSLNGIALGGGGGGWDYNGTSLNGLRLNAGYLNGSRVGGGWDANGIELNGLRLNSPSERRSINGLNLNASLNGSNLNGAVVGALALRVEGGKLVLTADGQRLPDAALAGARLQLRERASGRVLELEIVSITASPEDKALAFYEIAIDKQPVCREGYERGVFIAGSFDESGRYQHDPRGETVSYACEDGVMEKCVLWGYASWATSVDAYQTCTRMARADYCGDGRPWTRDGTLIDIFDDIGVQQATNDPSLTFEAGWGPDGAVCVSAPRYDVVDAAGAAVRPPCWDAKPRCASLDGARDHGAIIANASGHVVMEACAR